MATATKAAGCYKCGKTGHWSRDCTATPSGWVGKQGISSQATAGLGKAGSQVAQLGLDSAENDPTYEPVAPKLTSSKKKRPKVTLELLERPEGLDDIYGKFPGSFRTQFKGKGHEVGDLRRLLEMYKRWQERIFPTTNFDDFIRKVEKLSGTNGTKHAMRSKRMKIIQEFQDALLPPAAPVEEHDAPLNTETPGAHFEEQHNSAGLAPFDDDLDELLELEDVGHPAAMLEPVGGCGRPLGQQNQGGAEAAHRLDDADQLYEVEELVPNEDEMALLDELEEDVAGHNPAGPWGSAAQQPCSGGGAVENFNIDDEDMLYEVDDNDGAQFQPRHVEAAEAAGSAGQGHKAAGATGDSLRRDCDGLHADRASLHEQQKHQDGVSLSQPANEATKPTLPAVFTVPTVEASTGEAIRVGTEEVVHAAYKQVAVLHDSEPLGELLEDDEDLLEMVAEEAGLPNT